MDGLLLPHRRFFSSAAQQRLDSLTALFRDASSSGSTSQASPRISCQQSAQLRLSISVPAMARRRLPATPTIRSSLHVRRLLSPQVTPKRPSRSHTTHTSPRLHLGPGELFRDPMTSKDRPMTATGRLKHSQSISCSRKGPIQDTICININLLGPGSGCDTS
jgi:hypothetical protein